MKSAARFFLVDQKWNSSLEQPVENLSRFGTLSVVGIGGRAEDCPVYPDDIGRRNWQFPTFIAIDERQVNKCAPVDRLLVIGNAVHQSELAGHLIARIAEQRKTQ